MAIERVQTPRGERTRDTETGRFVSNSIKEFADKVVDGQKAATDSIKGVVQTLQQKVGGAIVPFASGTTEAFANERTDPQGVMAMSMGDHLVELGDRIVDELYDMGMFLGQSIQDAATQIVDGVSSVFSQLLDYEKDKDRMAKDQSTELFKEGPGSGSGTEDMMKGPKMEAAADGFWKGLLAGVVALRAAMLARLAPIIRFFSKTGPFGRILARLGILGGLLGRFGPLGLLITAIMLIVHYADDLKEALAPVIDAIKKVIVELKPILEALMVIGDLMIKSGIAVIGAALEIAFGVLAESLAAFKDVIVGLAKIAEGLFTLNPDLIKEGFEQIVGAFREWWTNVKTIIVETFTKLGDKIGEIFGIEDFNEKVMEIVGDVFGPVWASLQAIVENIRNIFNGEELLENIKGLVFNLRDVVLWPINQAIILIGKMFGWDGTYDGEPFSIQSWISSKVKEIWEGIKSFFSFDLPEMPKFRLPSFAEVWDKMVAAVLPEPDGWFGSWFYKFFPGLKTAAADAVSSTNVAKSYDSIVEQSNNEMVTNNVDKSKVSKLEKADTENNSVNLLNSNSGNSQTNNRNTTDTILAVNLKKEKFHVDPWGDLVA